MTDKGPLFGASQVLYWDGCKGKSVMTVSQSNEVHKQLQLGTEKRKVMAFSCEFGNVCDQIVCDEKGRNSLIWNAASCLGLLG